MPVIEHKTTFELTASGIALLLLIILGVLAFLAFCNDYPSLGMLCISLIFVIGGLWLWIKGSELVGLIVLAVGIILFLGTAWLGTPLLEGQEIIR